MECAKFLTDFDFICFIIIHIATCTLLTDVDLQLLGVTFLDEVAITRDVPRLHNLTVNISNPSTYNIIPLQASHIYNFKLKYFLSYEMTPNVTEMMLIDSPDQPVPILDQGGVVSSGTSGIPFTVFLDLTMMTCEQFTYLCVVVNDLESGSWTELNSDDNVLCANISQHMRCHPGKILYTSVIFWRVSLSTLNGNL